MEGARRNVNCNVVVLRVFDGGSFYSVGLGISGKNHQENSPTSTWKARRAK
jgi:hypothetical protein